jgi:hypothetical protein
MGKKIYKNDKGKKEKAGESNFELHTNVNIIQIIKIIIII